jgi:hypothetical protein
MAISALYEVPIWNLREILMHGTLPQKTAKGFFNFGGRDCEV